ncbi:uncharacterized protein LOC123783786 [Ursus americanus]|uniref:uncharacterized protein LOC123783786 n=1 Tax=Ursus americanus TaxID=9643 RepID=UPI001E679137|nr:uncharacterized protein LOC123783786 [Ursus americanus]
MPANWQLRMLANLHQRAADTKGTDTWGTQGDKRARRCPERSPRSSWRSCRAAAAPQGFARPSSTCCPNPHPVRPPTHAPAKTPPTRQTARKAAVGPLISPNISPAPALSLTPAWSLHLRPKGSPHHSKTSGHRGLTAEHRASLWGAPGGSGQRLWPEAQLSRLCRDEVSTYTHKPQPGYQGKEPSHVGPGGLPGGKGTTGRGRKGHRVRVRLL